MMIQKTKSEIQKILKSERGIALMMIMTAIIILMAIYGEFTFDSKISRLKATNILDRSQAKLLAESGVQLAMARLKLYKEAFNYVENNPQAKAAVPGQLINQLWEVPFIFPIPVGEGANATVKETVKKFTDENLLEGEMKVTIQNISNRLNLNLLRVDVTKFDPNNTEAADDANNSQLNMSDTAISSDVSIDQSLFFLLKKQVEDKKEKDEAFEDRYSNLNYQELVTNLKFYMSDFQSMNQDPLAADAERDFEKVPLTPKYGPLGSASELYSVPGWNDELIELIQNEFSVYPTTQIDFNKVTSNMLKVLIPSMTDEQITDFFEYRDDAEKPHYFNTLPDFKAYIVDQAKVMDANPFDERMNMFSKKGISFGSNPNLFKIVSEGTYNRSVYTLVAYVVLPKPTILGQAQAGAAGAAGGNGGVAGTANAGAGGGAAGGATAAGAAGGGTNQTTQLQEPRIIEIQIN